MMENQLSDKLTLSKGIKPMGLDINEYQRLAARTAKYKEDLDPITYLTGKLSCEASEVHQAHLKKAYHDKPADDAEADALLKEELGDTLWYVAETARKKGWKLSEVASENLVKLEKRHLTGKDGFLGFDMENEARN